MAVCERFHKTIVGAAGSSPPGSGGGEPKTGLATRCSISASRAGYSADKGETSTTPYCGRSSQRYSMPPDFNMQAWGAQ